VLRDVLRLAAELDLSQAPRCSPSRCSVASERPFHGEVDEFHRAVGSARSVLFLTDNAGEIAIDRLLAKHLPLERTTFAVRGAPMLNDATSADAGFAGLARFAALIDNGPDAPGTILADCSPEFRRRFAAADLIVAKGQGDYEALGVEPRVVLHVGEPGGELLEHLDPAAFVPSRRLGHRGAELSSGQRRTGRRHGRAQVPCG
jgi:hypothetical protein